MFRRVKLSEFDPQPVNTPATNTAEVPFASTPIVNVVATEPLGASLLAPKPAVLAEESTNHFALSVQTGWAMLNAHGGTRLWPYNSTEASVTPLLFKSQEPQLPVFLDISGKHQPEVVLCGVESGQITHIRRIPFQTEPITAKIPLSGETLVKAIPCGYNVVVATSTGTLWLVQLSDGFGGVARAPKLSKITRSWFQWSSPIQDVRAHNDKIAVLRLDGTLNIYHIGSICEHLHDTNLNQVNGYIVSVDFVDSHVFVLSKSEEFYLNIFQNGLLKQQRILRGVEESQGYVEVQQDLTVYVQFPSRLIVLNYGMAQSNGGVLQPLEGTIWFDSRVVGFKSSIDGCVILTSKGVLQVSSDIKGVSLDSLLGQAVFHWTPESPLTFVPGIVGLQNQGLESLADSAVRLANEIATSQKVALVPNIAAHLQLRSRYLKALRDFLAAKFGLEIVAIQNTWEKLVTASHLNSGPGGLSHDWLLHHTDRVLDKVKNIRPADFVAALSRTLAECAPRKPDPDYWLANRDLVQYLQKAELTPDSVRIQCTALACMNHTAQEQNQLLKGLAQGGYVHQARAIAEDLNLLTPLASICTDEWLATQDIVPVTSLIEQHGFEFARLVFDHLKAIHKRYLISEFPNQEYVYRYLDDEPEVQWAYDRLAGNGAATAKLERACGMQQDRAKRLVLASLLKLQALSAGAQSTADEATREIAAALARDQLESAPTPAAHASLFNSTDDLVLKLVLQPPSINNHVRAVNLLPQATAVHAKLVALVICANTDWSGSGDSTLRRVLDSPLADPSGIALIKRQLSDVHVLSKSELLSIVSAKTVARWTKFFDELEAKIHAEPTRPWERFE